MKAARKNPILVLLAAAIVLALYINIGKVLLGTRYVTLLADIFVGGIGAWVLFTHLLAGRKFLAIELFTAGFMLLGMLLILHPNVPSVVVGIEGHRSLVYQMIGLFIGVRGIRSREDFFYLITIIVTASTPILIYGIKQFFYLSAFDYSLIASNTAALDTWQLFGKVRSFGLFNGPFHLGLCSGIVFWLTAGIWLEDRRKFWIPVMLVAFLACIASLTRSSLIALIGSIPIVLFVVYRKYRLRVTVITAGIAICIGISALVLRTEWEQLGQLMDSISSFESIAEDSRLASRFEGYQQSASLIWEHPLGLGMGAAGDAMAPHFEPHGKIHVTSHNLFLWVVLETGIAGLLLFLLIAYSLVRAVLLLLLAGESTIAAVAAGILLIILIAGITGSTIGAYPVNLIFWTLCGAFCSLASGTTVRRRTSDAA